MLPNRGTEIVAYLCKREVQLTIESKLDFKRDFTSIYLRQVRGNIQRGKFLYVTQADKTHHRTLGQKHPLHLRL